MNILTWILFGLIVGALAKLVMPGRDPGGIIVTMLLGIAGAVVGGMIGRGMGLYEDESDSRFLHVVPRRGHSALRLPAHRRTPRR
jgi:uncharacterized membrane protein YeaQ/YmgE (transglycosylase-associated protein family)